MTPASIDALVSMSGNGFDHVEGNGSFPPPQVQYTQDKCPCNYFLSMALYPAGLRSPRPEAGYDARSGFSEVTDQ